MRSSPAPSRRDRDHLGGAPFALPPWIDRLSDRWWGLTPRARTVLLVALALGAVFALAARPLLAEEAPPVTVLVAERDLPRGHELADGDLTPRRWPAELAPPTAAEVAAGTLLAPLPAGGALTDAHTTPAGVAGLVPPGTSAVPLPVDQVPPVPVGSTVAVVTGDHDGRGVALTSDAEVVAVDGSSLWVAVATEQAADVAGAALRQSVTLVLRAP
ncbi:hypothetical protein FTX61_06855 [Nitriliruptoraceae bacterium ZYF776]|nr:hypothetical protein [Profundirhabdus halotolerans]